MTRVFKSKEEWLADPTVSITESTHDDEGVRHVNEVLGRNAGEALFAEITRLFCFAARHQPDLWRRLGEEGGEQFYDSMISSLRSASAPLIEETVGEIRKIVRQELEHWARREGVRT
jgi:hypothetical protein